MPVTVLVPVTVAVPVTATVEVGMLVMVGTMVGASVVGHGVAVPVVLLTVLVAETTLVDPRTSLVGEA